MVDNKKKCLWNSGHIFPEKKGEDPIITIGNHRGGIDKKMQVHANTENDKKKNIDDRFVSE